MLVLNKLIIIAISILLLSSCTNRSESPSTIALTVESVQYDSFEVSVRQFSLDDDTRICGDFSQEQFSMAGVYAEQLSPQLLDSIRLTINGDTIKYDDLDIVRADSGHAIYDDNGLIGTYGGWFSVCMILELDSGSHTATLEVRDLANIPHRYTWDFIVE